MESPLYLSEWKQEPESPPQNIYEESDSWFFNDDLATSNDYTTFKSNLLLDPSIKDEAASPLSKAEVVNKLLEDLDELDQLDDFIKEETFSSWLEEKIDLPIFENIPIEPAAVFQQPRLKVEELKPISNFPQNLQIVPQNLQPQINTNIQLNQSGGNTVMPAENTNIFLQDFENVYPEMTHDQLTPPQSPPLTPCVSPTEQVLTQLNPIPASTFQILQNTTPTLYYQQATGAPIVLQSNNIPQHQLHQLVQHQIAQQAANVEAAPAAPLNVERLPQTPQPDVAIELAYVEELVRSRVENMVESWNNSASSNSVNSSSIVHSPGSPSSCSSSGFSEYSSDPEWIPEPVHHTASGDSLVSKPSRGRKRAGKPYSRIGPEDKKSRKKEQNKNAATRYRLKKKAEIEEILTEEKKLSETKQQLKTNVLDLQREIKCLKGLMRDLFKAKGLIQ